MTTLLITAIAGDVAQAIAQIVRETFPDWRILGCDIHFRHGAALFVDEWSVAPRADSINYQLWIESQIKKKKVDICLPMSEAELLYFTKAGIRNVADTLFVMPNAQAIEVGCDKLTTARFLMSVGCPAPWTIPASECNDETPIPCVIKPRRGAGSKDVFICNTMKEARFFSERYPDSILQELLLPEDQEVTCAIYRTLDGRIAVLQLLRKLAGGSTVWAKVIDNPEIQNQCRHLASKLELRGSINVQLRVTNQGPRIFEINPRFSSTVRIRHIMGFTDIIWALKEITGDKIELVSPPKGLIGIRTQQASLLNVNDDYLINQFNSPPFKPNSEI